ncbi:hypothetical protein RIF23_08160 [Lipingzhangella sp. LS1_29]|uniref:Uncharacterized protein n=1 Tax=Lipingzhangella rawalii TaxID=2055835 RepID=A0ABU2H4N9_9ACTN|nr:hypothetical protein [Lipingzhangella rawalii]MDS1270265.1 hypothetical protein [Lipingzhangella rawalii]
MPVDATTTARPSDQFSWPQPRPAPVADLDGIGDIVDAGRAIPYPELQRDSIPTVGQLLSTAEHLATLLGTDQQWPDGTWAEHPVSARLRVRAVALRPSGFVSLPPPPASPCPHGGGLLYLARGQAHMVTVSAVGELETAHALAETRGRILARPDVAQVVQLLNTGDRPALLVHVTPDAR